MVARPMTSMRSSIAAWAFSIRSRMGHGEADQAVLRRDLGEAPGIER
jgi:hypothetical protein